MSSFSRSNPIKSDTLLHKSMSRSLSPPSTSQTSFRSGRTLGSPARGRRSDDSYLYDPMSRGSFGSRAVPQRKMDTFRKDVGEQVRTLTSELAGVRESLRSQFDNLSRKIGSSRGPSEGHSFGASPMHPSELEGRETQHPERSSASSGYVHPATDPVYPAPEHKSGMEGIGTSDMYAFERRMNAIERHVTDKIREHDDVLDAFQRRMEEVLLHLEAQESRGKEVERVLSSVQTVSKESTSRESQLEERIVELEKCLRVTQERLEGQIRWGNDLEENTSSRVSELQDAVADLKVDICTMQRSTEVLEDHVSKMKGGATGTAELKTSIEMLENEISVLHRRLTNALRVFNAPPMEPLGTTEEDIFLMKTSKR